MFLVLTPKPGKKTEIGATIAEIEIKSVSPECNRVALENWLKQAPKFVKTWTAYNLDIR